MFGGGGGHTFEMIARMKANLALRKKKGYFKASKDNPLLPGKTKVSFKQSSPKDIELVKEKIKLDRKKEIKQNVLIIIASIIATILLMLFAYYILSIFVEYERVKG